MTRTLLLLITVLATGAAARAEIEFAGLLAMPGKTLFALTDTATARTEWVALQGHFGDYVLTGFEASTDTLVLARGAATISLTLKAAQVKSSRLELTGTISFGAGEKISIERATLLFGQDNVFPLKDGLTYRIKPTVRPDGTHRYDIAIEQRDASGRVDRMSAPAIIARPAQPFSLQVGDYGFTFAPRP